MIRLPHSSVPALLAIGLAACEPPGRPLGPPALDARFGRPDVVVVPGASIQAAIDAARPGDRIFVRPGRYRESLRIDKPDIHLVGLGRRLGSAGDGVPVIENPGGEEDGIRVTDGGDGVEIVNFVIRGFEENGVFLVRVDGFRLSELVTEDDGEYGLFPVASSNGVIEDCVASGHSDTGIYVGQSTHVVIRRSTAFGNVNGFEIENSSDVHAYENEAFANTAGLLVALVPGLPVKAAADVFVERNRLHDNNLPNFASGGFEALVPQGSGLLIIGVDRVTARDNEVTGNEFVGIGLAGSTIIPLLGGGAVDDIEPFPDGSRIVENRVTGNGGARPIPILPPGVDLLWDGTGTDNCWAGNAFDTSLNLDLPGGSPTPRLPPCA